MCNGHQTHKIGTSSRPYNCEQLTVRLHSATTIEAVQPWNTGANKHVGESIDQDDHAHPSNQWRNEYQKLLAAESKLPATCGILHAFSGCPFAFVLFLLVCICLQYMHFERCRGGHSSVPKHTLQYSLQRPLSNSLLSQNNVSILGCAWLVI